MKKICFLSFILLLGMLGAQAQFKIGISGGLPAGDSGDAASYAVLGDMAYFFELSDDFYAGPMVGYSFSFGDAGEKTKAAIQNFAKTPGDNISFLPVGGSFRYYVTDRFLLGIDLAYAIGFNDGNKGGLHYAPKIAYSLGNVVDLVAAYRAISSLEEEGYWDILSLGFEFNFN